MRKRKLALLLTALLFGAATFAQENPAEVARRNLLQGADTARAAGDHARALELATRAAQIRMTTSVRLLLAQENEATGNLVASLDHATGCVREAEADSALRNRDQLLEICRALVASVTPRVGSLVVHVDAPPHGLVVRVAGHEVNAALYGVPFPVMPGAVVVEVGGEGIVAAREEVRVAAGARAETTPRVRVEERPVAIDFARVTASTPARETLRSGPGAGPWVFVGVGAAAAITGGVLLALGASEHSNALQQCPNMTCANDGAIRNARTSDDRYVTFTNTGIWAVAGGGALLATGLIWYAVAPRSERARAVSWSIVPSATGVVVGVGGTL